MESPHISPQKARIRQRVKMALEGKPYDQIHDETGMNGKPEFKSQTVYSSLKNKTAQEAFAELLPNYNPESLRRKLTRIIDRTSDDKPEAPQVRVIELAMREQGMLKDQIDVNVNAQVVTVQVEIEAKSALEGLEVLALPNDTAEQGKVEP